jgi:hypothetical protein
MEIKLEIPEYSPDIGMKYNWEADFNIEVKYEDGIVVLKANKAGLFSLANHLLNLAQEEIPIGYHFHFDEGNSLEEGSTDLIIQKK